MGKLAIAKKYNNSKKSICGSTLASNLYIPAWAGTVLQRREEWGCEEVGGCVPLQGDKTAESTHNHTTHTKVVDLIVLASWLQETSARYFNMLRDIATCPVRISNRKAPKLHQSAAAVACPSLCNSEDDDNKTTTTIVTMMKAVCRNLHLEPHIEIWPTQCWTSSHPHTPTCQSRSARHHLDAYTGKQLMRD